MRGTIHKLECWSWGRVQCNRFRGKIKVFSWLIDFLLECYFIQWVFSMHNSPRDWFRPIKIVDYWRFHIGLLLPVPKLHHLTNPSGNAQQWTQVITFLQPVIHFKTKLQIQTHYLYKERKSIWTMGEKPVTSPWKGWNVNATPAPTLFEDVMSQVKKMAWKVNRKVQSYEMDVTVSL